MTRKYDKGDQPIGEETTCTSTGATRYGRGQHKTLRPNHGTQRLPTYDDDDDDDDVSLMLPLAPESSLE